jgi:hypothetical protein
VRPKVQNLNVLILGQRASKLLKEFYFIPCRNLVTMATKKKYEKDKKHLLVKTHKA